MHVTLVVVFSLSSACCNSNTTFAIYERQSPSSRNILGPHGVHCGGQPCIAEGVGAVAAAATATAELSCVYCL